jgi:hypothetical protein
VEENTHNKQESLNPNPIVAKKKKKEKTIKKTTTIKNKKNSRRLCLQKSTKVKKG